MTPSRRRRRLIHNINVIPYIDVMLVLLVIFMVTAPLLQQSVKVNLPSSQTPLSQTKQKSITITVNSQGYYYLNNQSTQPLTLEELVKQMKQLRGQQPKTSVLIAGDKDINYGKIVELMISLQQEHIDNIGLLTTTNHDRSWQK